MTARMLLDPRALRTVFLHGLGGVGSEWDALQERVPAHAPDLRPGDDPRAIIGDEPVVLIGHSLGGHHAFRMAATEPSLVSRLVVIEASPERNETAPDDVRTFFSTHPAPYGVRVDPEAAAAAVKDLARRDWWDTWAIISCPILVVRGENGHLARAVAARMAASAVRARSVEIAGAGHDVHLDQPAALAEELVRFSA